MTLPAPGSLERLPDDESCAEDLLDVLRITARNGRSRTAIRSLIGVWWVGKRVPDVVTAVRRGWAVRSSAWPHSPEAIAATIRANAAGVRPALVNEHVLLVGDLVEMLFAELNTLTPATMVERLHGGHHFAVITKEEDARLKLARVEQNMPPGWQPGDALWARYLHAGLDPATFQRLPYDIAIEAAAIDRRRRSQNV